MINKTCFLIYVYNTFVYNIYSIVILILFDIPRFSVNDLHQIQVASSRKSDIQMCRSGSKQTDGGANYKNDFLGSSVYTVGTMHCLSRYFIGTGQTT